MKSINKVLALGLLFSVACQQAMELPKPAQPSKNTPQNQAITPEFLRKIEKEIETIISIVNQRGLDADSASKKLSVRDHVDSLARLLKSCPSLPNRPALIDFGTTAWALEKDPSNKALLAKFLNTMRAIKLHQKPQPAVQLKECNICFEPSKLAALSCGHEYCLDCLSGHINARLSENDHEIKCPNPQCKKSLSEKDIKLITSDPKVFEKIDLLQLKKWITDQKNIKHCPTPNCKFSFINETNEQFTVRCTECKKDFCGKCEAADSHSRSFTCREFELSKNLDAANKASEEWKKINTKPCPKCSKLLQKDGGCNHMTCKQCRYEFCWECLADWYRHDGVQCANNRQRIQQPVQPRQQDRIERIHQNNVHRLFARDPYGVAAESLRIPGGQRIPQAFVEQFTRLSCAKQQEWIAVVEELVFRDRQHNNLVTWSEAMNEITLAYNTIPKQLNAFIHSETGPQIFWDRRVGARYTIRFNTQGIRPRELRALLRQHTEYLGLLFDARIEQMREQNGFIYYMGLENDWTFDTNLGRAQIQSALDQFNEYMRDVLAHAANNNVPHGNQKVDANRGLPREQAAADQRIERLERELDNELHILDQETQNIINRNRVRNQINN